MESGWDKKNVNLKEHCDRTEKKIGIRAEDIHKWIDGHFDFEGFANFIKNGKTSDFNPYDHRKHRHCKEALESANIEFSEQYTSAQIKTVFEMHLRDDYNGYLPYREDFTNGKFREKYHETNNNVQNEAILSETELFEYFKGQSYADYKQSKHLNRSKFAYRIVIPTILAIILFITSIFIIIIPVFRSNMMKQKKEMIKELVTSASSIIYYYINLQKTGTLTKDVAQQKSILEIEKMRYGINNKDYFWITDMQPSMIMHPYSPELIGKNLSNYRDIEDKSGKMLFVDFVNLVKKYDEGYLEYMWQWMDDENKQALKLSYVHGIKDWGWIIGTGVYINDIDEEMKNITFSLFEIEGIISIIIIIILIYVVIQSKFIENSRLYAVAGLREAKDRYRALVEASNEGYILFIEGEIVYSNLTIQRMLDYSEDEIIAMKPWMFFDDNLAINTSCIDYLKRINKENLKAVEFEAKIKTKQGLSRDMIINISRIFFSEKNGHIIALRKRYSLKNSGLKPYNEINELMALSPTAILLDIENSKTTGHIIHSLDYLFEIIRKMIKDGAKPDVLRNTIGKIYNAAIERIIEISIDEIGTSPVCFSFLSLGSNARYEMTFFSDQDNALVFENVPEEEIKNIRQYFLKLAESVCSKLNQSGFNYCPGGIMAANPLWCLSLSEWEKKISGWIVNVTPDSILKINVVTDMRSVYGEKQLCEYLKNKIFQYAENNPRFFYLYSQNCISYKLPLDLFGRIKGDIKDGTRMINIKYFLKQLEVFGRIYAIKYKIASTETIDRLQYLMDNRYLHEETFYGLVYVFEYLWNLRFYNQISSHANLRSVNDELDLDKLTDIEMKNLKNIFSKISIIQSKISFDFLGQDVT